MKNDSKDSNLTSLVIRFGNSGFLPNVSYDWLLRVTYQKQKFFVSYISMTCHKKNLFGFGFGRSITPDIFVLPGRPKGFFNISSRNLFWPKRKPANFWVGQISVLFFLLCRSNLL